MSRWEVGLFILGAVTVTSWLKPRVETMIWRSRRAEAEMVLDQLCATLQEHGGRSAGQLAFTWTPQAPDRIGTHRIPWPDDALPVDWTPPTRSARCAYEAQPLEGTLRLTARCDVDGDGVHAVYTTTLAGPVARSTAPDVY
jgi:hypothetical protein